MASKESRTKENHMI